MLHIRKEQMDILEQSTFDRLTDSIMEQIRSKYSDRVPESDVELRHSIVGWIEDAHQWGFKTDDDVTQYVNFCARTQGRREPIELRLQTYLQIYHERLLGRVDVQNFVRTVMHIAAQYSVRADEGVAWLAVILLAGQQKGDTNRNWIESILSQPHVSEEAKLFQVHQQATARGWIAADGGL